MKHFQMVTEKEKFPARKMKYSSGGARDTSSRILQKLLENSRPVG